MPLFVGMLVKYTYGILPVKTPVPPLTMKVLSPSISQRNPILGEKRIFSFGQIPVLRCIGLPSRSLKVSAVFAGFSKGSSGKTGLSILCLLYTSDAADERSSVD